jgi:hypothetical protein
MLMHMEDSNVKKGTDIGKHRERQREYKEMRKK